MLVHPPTQAIHGSHAVREGNEEDLNQVFAKALAPFHLEKMSSAVFSSFDFAWIRVRICGSGLFPVHISDSTIVQLYFIGQLGDLAPNDFFDEAWYKKNYRDVENCVNSAELPSGFIHFISHGLEEGRWPNQRLHDAAQSIAIVHPARNDLDDAIYLTLNPEAVNFLSAFPGVTATYHYNRYGRFLGYLADGQKGSFEPGVAAMMRQEFDPSFYISRYLADGEAAIHRQDPFRHYVMFGQDLSNSPNSWFDEAWYRAFYPAVRTAIRDGHLTSGFHHFIVAGRAEGRLPHHNLERALEAAMPGVTQPVLLESTRQLQVRMRGLSLLPTVTSSGLPTVWMFLPTVNPDIMFGGYRAALELICALKRNGHRVKIVCAEEPPNWDYFIFGYNSRALTRRLEDTVVLSVGSFQTTEVTRMDQFIAYSVWDLPTCLQLTTHTGGRLPVLLAQEYEPIFYEHGSRRAVCESLYQLPYRAIVNSDLLLAFLRGKKVGPFSKKAFSKRVARYGVFEHPIPNAKLPSARRMANRRRRLLVAYARPEAHASRNMFELVILALESACQSGCFGNEWSFLGLGALSDLKPIALGGGHKITLKPKLAESEYRKMIRTMDIGISLMGAPHPSVVPFEFATTGALVVTNTYENRPPALLKGVSENIVPCELNLRSVCDAIIMANSLVREFDRRIRNALRPKSTSWEDAFPDGFIQSHFGPSRQSRGNSKLSR